MKSDKLLQVYLILPLILLLLSCSNSVKEFNEHPKEISTAFTNHEQTVIGKLFYESALKHPQKSGFTLIRQGRNAFTDR